MVFLPEHAPPNLHLIVLSRALTRLSRRPPARARVDDGGAGRRPAFHPAGDDRLPQLRSPAEPVQRANHGALESWHRGLGGRGAVGRASLEGESAERAGDSSTLSAAATTMSSTTWPMRCFAARRRRRSRFRCRRPSWTGLLAPSATQSWVDRPAATRCWWSWNARTCFSSPWMIKRSGTAITIIFRPAVPAPQTSTPRQAERSCTSGLRRGWNRMATWKVRSSTPGSRRITNSRAPASWTRSGIMSGVTGRSPL